jgi:hypothetical protein
MVKNRFQAAFGVSGSLKRGKMKRAYCKRFLVFAWFFAFQAAFDAV